MATEVLSSSIEIYKPYKSLHKLPEQKKKKKQGRKQRREARNMSLVFSPIKVVAGPMMSIKEHQVGVPAYLHGDKKDKLVLEERRKVEELVVLDRKGINGYSFGKREAGKRDLEEDDGSSQSSSIGALSSSSSEDEEENGDEVQSKLKDEGLFCSLSSMEESLPIKRGLSNYFAGKSKSFASLTEAAGGHAKDLSKPENPFNKRRRILMSYKASSWRRASCTSLIASFPPPLSPEIVKEVEDEEVEEDGEEDEEEKKWGRGFPLVPLPNLRSSFKNPRSLSMSDLQNV